jgi:hypothetical protein
MRAALLRLLPVPLLLVMIVANDPAHAQFSALAEPGFQPTGDQLVAKYLAMETARLQSNCLREVQSLEDWNAKKGEYRRQLFDMLGLDPLPPRTEMQATTTGTTDHAEFTVEKVHYQSMPKLYVTGNLYVPKNLKSGEKVPAILYVCGHGAVKKDGISYGNKVYYQHHGAWFARHGYVCLTIDSLQLGEIEALHHGLYRESMWWWPGRGYTPAGVEAWNCIRALDYLQARPEVNGEKLGVTGRSGGGTYSWWIAALDDRIKAAVPVAGITDLQNHVVDGCVEGHCDCMYFNNTYEWDYPQVAALVAPRPLMISNTDRDGIFPLDGVYRTFVGARRIYALDKAADEIGFNVTPGLHVDTQELQVPAFRWFNQHLLGVDRQITRPAEKFFELEQLRVFDKLPEDQINTKIQETFVALAPAPMVPADKEAWQKQRDGWLANLKDRSFRAWPEPSDTVIGRGDVASETRDNLTLRWHYFNSQDPYNLDLFVIQKDGLKKPEIVVLNVLDPASWQELLATVGSKFDKTFAGIKLPPADEKAFHDVEQTLTDHSWAFVYFAPRGVGPTAWTQEERKATNIRRRFLLLGQTDDGMRAWDVRRAIQAVRQMRELKDVPLWLQSHRQMAGVTLAASLFEPNVTRLDLYDLPNSLRDGPTFINAQRYLDTPALVAMAAERSKVVLYCDDSAAWEYPRAVVEKLGWQKQIQIRNPNVETRNKGE